MKTAIRALACLAIAVLVAVASIPRVGAQGYSRGQRYSRADVDRIIKAAEDYSDKFKDFVDHRLDRSYMDGSRTEDRINDQVSELEKAFDELRDDFDHRESWWESRSKVQDVTREGRDIHLLIDRRKFPRSALDEWAPLRRAINTLADVYQLPRVGHRYR